MLEVATAGGVDGEYAELASVTFLESGDAGRGVDGAGGLRVWLSRRGPGSRACGAGVSNPLGSATGYGACASGHIGRAMACHTVAGGCRSRSGDPDSNTGTNTKQTGGTRQGTATRNLETHFAPIHSAKTGGDRKVRGWQNGVAIRANHGNRATERHVVGSRPASTRYSAAW
jgi:hypothetical protein